MAAGLISVLDESPGVASRRLRFVDDVFRTTVAKEPAGCKGRK